MAAAADAAEQETGQVASADYDAGYALAQATGQDQGSNDSSNTAQPAAELATDEQPSAAPAADEPAAKPAAEAPPKEDHREKALRDTQRWATTLLERNKALEQQIAALKAGTGSQERVDAAQRAVDNAKGKLDDMIEQVSADYPELQQPLQAVVTTLNELRSEVATLKQGQERSSSQAAADASRQVFEALVKPKLLQAHPDYESLVARTDADGRLIANPDFFQWAEGQRPALRYAALDSLDADDMIWAIGEYKKYRGTPEAAAIRQRDAAEKREKLQNTATLRGSGGTPFPVAAAGSADPDDYDAGFALAIGKK